MAELGGGTNGHSPLPAEWGLALAVCKQKQPVSAGLGSVFAPGSLTFRAALLSSRVSQALELPAGSQHSSTPLVFDLQDTGDKLLESAVPP